jgi:hypothetical protein
MRGKRTPAKRRAEAAGIALMDGAAEASRQTGIPENTIRGWLDSPEFAELRTRKTEAVAEEWWGGVQKAFRRTVELLERTDDPVKAATAGAIMFDKLALTRGQATSRTETRALSDELDDHERAFLKQIILEEMDTREEAGSDSEPGVDTPTAPVPPA